MVCEEKLSSILYTQFLCGKNSWWKHMYKQLSTDCSRLCGEGIESCSYSLFCQGTWPSGSKCPDSWWKWEMGSGKREALRGAHSVPCPSSSASHSLFAPNPAQTTRGIMALSCNVHGKLNEDIYPASGPNILPRSLLLEAASLSITPDGC